MGIPGSQPCLLVSSHVFGFSRKHFIKSIKGDICDLRVFRFVFPLQAEKHHPALVKVLCAELGVEPEALLDFELCLTDTQPAVSVQIKR